MTDLDTQALRSVASAVGSTGQQKAMAESLVRHAASALARLKGHGAAWDFLAELAAHHLRKHKQNQP